MSAPRALDRLIRPRSIAVFGGKEARRVIEQCDRMGYAGPIWPVHPKRDAIAGRACFRSVDDLPDAPDAAFVGVNRTLTIDIVEALARRGAGGAVCYASGFAEAQAEMPDGPDLQRQLVAAAGAMPIIGPNCYGLINALDGALLWPDQHGLVRAERGVAILTQSSNIAINLSMQRRGLPIAYLMTAGNQAQTGLSALAEAAIEDPRVTAIGLHIEGFDDLRSLERLAMKARDLDKSIVALKVGKSEAAREAAISHTASLSGNDRISAGVLDRLGIGRVDSLPAMIETLKLLHLFGPLAGNTIASMSCSGGEASLMADAAHGRALRYPPIPESQKPVLRSTLGPMVTLANPLDYHTFVWGDLAASTAAFAAMMGGGYDLTMLVLDFPRLDRCSADDWQITIDALRAAAAQTGARAAVVASLPENMPEAVAEQLIADGILCLSGIDDAMTAAEVAARIGQSRRRPPARPLCGPRAGAGVDELLFEDRAKGLLAEIGLAVPEGVVAASPAQAADSAERIGFPVALKMMGIAHKSEAGAVRLGLADRDALVAAAEAMATLGETFLVERMAGRPVAELIVGLSEDAVAGPVLSIGAGGVLVELIEDSALLPLPATRDEIGEAIAGLRVARLLSGFRGAPAGDIDALVDAVARIADHAATASEPIMELDINPLFVMPKGEGVLAIDALIRRRKKP